MRKVNAVIFDWDNTLIDYWSFALRALESVLSKLDCDKEVTLDMLKTYACNYSLREYFPTLFKDDWQKARQIYYEYVRENHLKHLTPLANSLDTLEFLLKNEIPMAIVSNKDGAILRKEVEHLGWDGYFVNVLGSNDTPYDKPSPEPVYHTLKMLGLSSASGVLFVGDAMADIECALASGCTPVLIGDNIAYRPDKEISKAKSHKELIKLINDEFICDNN